ncbi:MAG: tRNA (adenosine(37)-N6)-dimethylallyltransferase MiaA [Acidobacteria bacterium]|nr:tRNA (adenosine(37)-N6)-dimethylallyltransferase MiaA [Acidobacteriota bacterium]
MSSTPTTPLVAIVGPTGSGKTALGVFLAERLNGEILCCDSTQLYSRFDIGTGKPTAAERHGIPHHLLDLLEPKELFTAGDYRQRAVAVLDDLRSRGKLPILTVGTGLYLRALLEGLADAPKRSEELRARLHERASECGPEHLHRILQRLDLAAAGRIGPRDEPKLIRAIEVCLLSGKPISEVHRAGRAPLVGYRAMKIGLMPPREQLYQSIEQRVDAMLVAGWLSELRQLMDSGIPASAKPFQFIGYSELRDHVEGKCDLDAAKKSIQQYTRRYAKRQLTWFRKETGVHWLTGFGSEGSIQNQSLELLETQLKASDSI